MRDSPIRKHRYALVIPELTHGADHSTADLAGRIRRSQAAVTDGNVPRFFGISRVILVPIWWQAWQPDFTKSIQCA